MAKERDYSPVASQDVAAPRPLALPLGDFTASVAGAAGFKFAHATRIRGISTYCQGLTGVTADATVKVGGSAVLSAVPFNAAAAAYQAAGTPIDIPAGTEVLIDIGVTGTGTASGCTVVLDLVP